MPVQTVPCHTICDGKFVWDTLWYDGIDLCQISQNWRCLCMFQRTASICAHGACLSAQGDKRIKEDAAHIEGAHVQFFSCLYIRLLRKRWFQILLHVLRYAISPFALIIYFAFLQHYKNKLKQALKSRSTYPINLKWMVDVFFYKHISSLTTHLKRHFVEEQDYMRKPNGKRSWSYYITVKCFVRICNYSRHARRQTVSKQWIKLVKRIARGEDADDWDSNTDSEIDEEMEAQLLQHQRSPISASPIASATEGDLDNEVQDAEEEVVTDDEETDLASSSGSIEEQEYIVQEEPEDPPTPPIKKVSTYSHNIYICFSLRMSLRCLRAIP